ncbi:hypothetical protein TWF173_011157 [Orbilia oligospora]|nr:hypothetical protein TWF173_011157 [Orbilia oligospora]
MPTCKLKTASSIDVTGWQTRGREGSQVFFLFGNGTKKVEFVPSVFLIARRISGSRCHMKDERIPTAISLSSCGISFLSLFLVAEECMYIKSAFLLIGPEVWNQAVRVRKKVMVW